MKNLLLLLLIFPISGIAQKSNFIAEGNKLVWENVFITNEANIPGLIARHPRLNISHSGSNIYKGSGISIKNNCPGTSSFMENEFSFDFEIETGEGKYRVTVSNLAFTIKGKNVSANSYFIEKTVLKNSKATEADLECLETFFNRLFTRTTIMNKSRM